ncbi:MAG TPA: hypothetical protein VF861_07565 [Telluria sp.]
MRSSLPLWRAAALAAALLSISVAAVGQNGDRVVDPAAANQQAAEIARGDPARWYRDDTTPAQRLRTLKKEIGAALHEAQNACRLGPKGERAACMATARATWEHDMAAARTEASAAN